MPDAKEFRVSWKETVLVVAKVCAATEGEAKRRAKAGQYYQRRTVRGVTKGSYHVHRST